MQIYKNLFCCSMKKYDKMLTGTIVIYAIVSEIRAILCALEVLGHFEKVVIKHQLPGENSNRPHTHNDLNVIYYGRGVQKAHATSNG